ncbi:MAG: DMT family transporter [Spirochaetaceae bacterium]|nr:DMT family transporter [Spirochaetaceae bacterium]
MKQNYTMKTIFLIRIRAEPGLTAGHAVWTGEGMLCGSVFQVSVPLRQHPACYTILPMNKRALKADVLLLLTAGIWGFGFVAQRSGMEYVGPFTFNGIRFILGSLSLLPLIFLGGRGKTGAVEGGATGEVPCGENDGKSRGRKSLLFASFAAGSCLFVAVTLQQLGIMFTTAGNAGFITGLYVVLTPMFGVFLGRKTGWPTWIGAGFTLTGLYFLSAAGHLDRINPGDIMVVVSALFWAFHVLLIDALVGRDRGGAEKSALIDPIKLSSGQFAWCGLYSLLAAFFIEPFIAGWMVRWNAGMLSGGLFAWRSLPAMVAAIGSEPVTASGIINALIPILYGGLASVGIAYTLQVVAQRDAPPAHATIILCLEGCFAAIGGAIILGETLGTWTLLGFILMLCGMLITQWDVIAGAGRR